MKPKQLVNSNELKTIYLFYFCNKTKVYVDLTANLKRRKREINSIKCCTNSNIIKLLKEGFKIEEVEILEENLTFEDAIIADKKWIKKYKKQYSENCLNISNGGELGGRDIIWNFENCKNEALKYDTKKKFMKNSCAAYSSAIKNGWIKKICKHMKELRKPNGYWNFKRCKKEAKKYSSKSLFYKNSKSAYLIARKNDWLKDICTHMKRPIDHKLIWTKEKCAEEAKKYKTKIEFRKKSSGAHRRAYLSGWLDEFFPKKNKIKT